MTILRNSATLQDMISSVSPGVGNMNFGQAPMPGQFQPYPTPRDMVMQMQQGYMMPPGYAMPYPYQMPQPPVYMQPTRPGNMITMMNGVPVELEYKPEMESTNLDEPMMVTYREIPGAPVDPSRAHLTGKTEYIPVNRPGRAFPNPATSPSFGQAMTEKMQNSTSTVGGVCKGGFFNPYYQYQPQYRQQQNYQPPKPPEIRGVVNVYDGQLVHPHVNDCWYGSKDFPFYNYARMSLGQPTQQDAGYGFTRTVTLPVEVQDMANLAAFYGMTYEGFLNNNRHIMKLLSRASNKYMGRSDEEISARQKFYDSPAFGGPAQADASGYPPWAFDWNGKFTREYFDQYCIGDSTKEIMKNMKVQVRMSDGSVMEGSRRRIPYTTSQDSIDRAIRGDYNRRYNLGLYAYKAQAMYNAAPERQLDDSKDNVFAITAKTLAVAEQRELDMLLQYQNASRSASTFNRENFFTRIKRLRDENKRNKQLKREEEWRQLVHKVGSPKGDDLRTPSSFMEVPYITDGDWVIAKPGLDIVGLPLEKSVNKIIRMNTVTGEEEIYDPSKPVSPHELARIRMASKPTFSNLDEDSEFERRMNFFKGSPFSQEELERMDNHGVPDFNEETGDTT